MLVIPGAFRTFLNTFPLLWIKLLSLTEGIACETGLGIGAGLTGWRAS